MTGTTVFPFCACVCVCVCVSEAVGADAGSPREASTSGEESAESEVVVGAVGAVAGGGKGDAGDDPKIPGGTTIGGNRYIRHQLMPPPGLRSEPATVRRVDGGGIAGSWGGGGDGGGGCER